MAICSPAVPGAAEAVKQAGRKDVKVIGLGLPSENRSYVHEGITDCIVLWKTEDLGYLTVYAAQALKKGTLAAGSRALKAGRLGNVEIQPETTFCWERRLCSTRGISISLIFEGGIVQETSEFNVVCTLIAAIRD